MKPSTKYRPTATACAAATPARRPRAHARKWIDAAAVAQEAAAPPCCCCAARDRRAAAGARTERARRRRRRPAGERDCRSRRRRGTRAPPNSASQNRRPNSSCGSRPSRIGAATIQNLSGGFSRKAAVSFGLLLGASQSPVSRMRSTREGIDRFVVLEISAAETDEQRQAEEHEHESQPGPAQAHSLMQVTSDQIRGMFTFSIETGLSSA